MNDYFKPTLNDVARAAAVSTATVSRCLNEPNLVAPQTRQRVLEVVGALGYMPNFGGRALASQRTNTIGAVIPTMENAIFARGLQAFQETLADAGVTLLVASSGYDPEREANQVRTLVARGADGLMLIGSARPQSTYEFLKRRGIPYVLTWNLGETDDCFVGFHNRYAAAAIAHRVLDFGHRNIAMISGVTNMNDRAADRVLGVKTALKDRGLDDATLTVIETEYSFEAGSLAFGQLMELRPRPTAIICGNDVLAVGSVACAKKLNLRVPGEISITGFDDIDIANVVEPALTTVHVPHRRMGSAAAKLLLDLIVGRQTVNRIEIGVDIAMRQSLGPPPGPDGTK